MPEKVSWQALFLIGGIAPLLMSAALLLWLPESIKFLSTKGTAASRSQLAKLIRRMRPGVDASADFQLPPEASSARAGVRELFRDGMQNITPLVWLLFICVLTSNYFLYNWLPLVFHINGFSSREAALTTACYNIGGVIGSLTISRMIDRNGLKPVVVFFALSCPVVASIGIPGLPFAAMAALVFVGGFFIFGVLIGLNAVAALLYPVRIRSTGAGWAFGVGRLGGIGGPMLGAALIKAQLPIQKLFLAPAIPMAIGAASCFIVMRLCFKRFGGYQLRESDTAHAEAPFSGEALKLDAQL